ncbi:hypothetical protein ACFE04_009386 [Oxalis oulophora]
MAVSIKLMSIIVITLGLASFVLGIIAENKKPASGTPIVGKGVVICNYPSDPTVVLGIFSIVFLLASSAMGYCSVFHSYKGKSVPKSVMFQNTTFTTFFYIAWFTAGLAAALLLWPTITEQMHLSRNVHHNLETTCPTAKTGVLGGGAFLAFDSALFWLVTLMLASNTRKDYFEDIKDEAAKLTVTAA